MGFLCHYDAMLYGLICPWTQIQIQIRKLNSKPPEKELTLK